ncbi:2-dehydro-3-deoxygalactonokinase [Roseibacterium sp. SDUM158017]|uniref:2-dehydro-3-deoxygalactonokinase n=1 Tax=Roseicyclus salinarum TaxID=3036773 RepID=UPI0024150977|nr:2-dehydro-3-deoxygalactonokinase [Roseibacterium sp. SDUM158017]MDG4647163.1 2-dehydro-3-deoxygalactonokinase [Roseibacterium sp. SDUM158017]
MSASRAYADWIAVDWGTTHLRAWAMAEDGTHKAEARSDDGMGVLTRAEFEPALLRLVEPWLGSRTVPVLVCGMAGSRQGWTEAPYVSVPAKPGELAPVPVETRDTRIRVSILPGLSQSSPSDVMRGEETQIAGFLAQSPGFDGILCLPGTHTKWVHLSAEEVVSFQSFMTGELFELLSERSVLRHSVRAVETDPEAFAEAVADTLSRPERLAQRLFSIRAETVLTGLGPEAARARLSGLLIGAELAGARAYWLGQEVVVAGAPALSALYAAALSAQGVAVRTLDADPLTRLGLAKTWEIQRETTS